MRHIFVVYISLHGNPHVK